MDNMRHRFSFILFIMPARQILSFFTGGCMENILSKVEQINGAVNGFVWGLPMLVLLVGTGILMTVLTRFFQVSHFKHWVKNTIGGIFKDKKVTAHTGSEDTQISQFQSLCTAQVTSQVLLLPSFRAVPEPFSGCGSLLSLE